MSGVRMELTGAEAALKQLGAAVARADKPRDLFDEVGASLVVSTQARFETQEGPDGSPWAPSLRATLEGGRTLVDTARLRSSITHNASDSGVEVGTNLVYASIHQTGGTIKAKTPAGLKFRRAGNGGWVTKSQVTIPARPFLGLDAEDEKEIEAIAGDWLMTPLGGPSGDSGGGDARR